MAWTYTTLTQAIKDYVQTTETTFSNNIPVFIKQAENRIVRTASLPVFRKNVTGAMTSGNQYLGVPTDFLSPFSLAIVNSSSYEYLLNKDVNYIRDISERLNYGRSEILRDIRQLIFYCSPDAQRGLFFGASLSL